MFSREIFFGITTKDPGSRPAPGWRL